MVAASTSTLTRALSFGRHRRKTASTGGKAPLPSSPTDVDGSSDSFDGARESSTDLAKELSGLLRKKHHHGGWGARYVHVDDRLGCILIYRSFVEWERREVQRVLPLFELATIKLHEPSDNGFDLYFRREQGFHREQGPETASAQEDDYRLTLKCASAEERSMWVRGLHWRIRQRTEGIARVPRLRRIVLRSDGAKRGSLTCENWPGSPLGALTADMANDGLARAAGLRVGEVLLAVNDTPVFSHHHCCSLIDTVLAPSGGAMAELLVATIEDR